MTDTTVQMCLVLVRDGNPQHPAVLLGRKQRGFGTGRVVAPGGKIDTGERPEQAAARELYEETGLVVDPAQLHPAGVVTFEFPHAATPTMRAHVFTVTLPEARPTDSDEINAHWTREDAVPYERMWDDTRYWLPRALAGTLDSATFVYAPDGISVERVDGLD